MVWLALPLCILIFDKRVKMAFMHIAELSFDYCAEKEDESEQFLKEASKLIITACHKIKAVISVFDAYISMCMRRTINIRNIAFPHRQTDVNSFS